MEVEELKRDTLWEYITPVSSSKISATTILAAFPVMLSRAHCKPPVDFQ